MPNFGQVGHQSYDSVTVEDQLVGSQGTPGTDGTAQSITVYMNSWSSGDECKCAIYLSDSGFTKVGETEELTTGGTGWKTFNFSEPKPSIINGSEYTLVAFGDDSSTTVDYWPSNSIYLRKESATYPNFPNSIAVDGWDTNLYNNAVGINCTYLTDESEPSFYIANPNSGKLTFLGGSKQLKFITK